jgi:hypothetical protein
MGEWRTASCIMCPAGCGLEILVGDNRMIKLLKDKNHLHCQGYNCCTDSKGATAKRSLLTLITVFIKYLTKYAIIRLIG